MHSISDLKLTSKSAKIGLLASVAAAPISSSIEDIAVAPPKPRRRYRARGRRHLDNGESRVARRALTGAQLYIEKKVSSLRAAADASGSTPGYVRAMITVVESGDARLLHHVLQGHIPLFMAAKRVKSIAKAVVAYRAVAADPAELAAFKTAIGMTSDPVEALLKMTESEQAEIGRRLTPNWTFDHLVTPALNGSKADQAEPNIAIDEVSSSSIDDNEPANWWKNLMEEDASQQEMNGPLPALSHECGGAVFLRSHQ